MEHYAQLVNILGLHDAGVLIWNSMFGDENSIAFAQNEIEFWLTPEDELNNLELGEIEELEVDSDDNGQV